VTGRVRASAPSIVYETANTRAISSPSALRSGVVPAFAVYAISRPPIAIAWCVTTAGGSAAAAGRACTDARHANSDATASGANLRIFTEQGVRRGLARAF